MNNLIEKWVKVVNIRKGIYFYLLKKFKLNNYEILVFIL